MDTNVVSEPMTSGGNPAVRIWLDQQVAETLFLTAVNLSELLLGIKILPQGKRQLALAATLGDQIRSPFGPRILPFDARAADAYASLGARSREAGRAISVVDGQIAAIALVHGFAVATRHMGPFVAAGLAAINPWHTPP